MQLLISISKHLLNLLLELLIVVKDYISKVVSILILLVGQEVLYSRFEPSEYLLFET
jgi:hypothetical protein